MAYYRPAGQDFYFPCPVPELEPYQIIGKEPSAAKLLTVPSPLVLSCRTVGLVGGEQREVETWSAPPGLLLKVAGGSDFYITPGGQYVVKAARDGNVLPSPLTGLDRDILLGPALVLALALRGTWSLHASAATFKDKLIVFLAESGQGKSTLATYLAGAGWQLVADDILPVTGDPSGMQAWPRFPQLKLPPESQPGPHLSEQLPLGKICLLLPAGKDDTPAVQLIPPGEAVKALLAHTAGARLFEPDLLSRHLEFCARSATQVPAYRLAYPHRRDALPIIKNNLESLC